MGWLVFRHLGLVLLLVEASGAGTAREKGLLLGGAVSDPPKAEKEVAPSNGLQDSKIRDAIKGKIAKDVVPKMQVDEDVLKDIGNSVVTAPAPASPTPAAPATAPAPAPAPAPGPAPGPVGAPMPAPAAAPFPAPGAPAPPPDGPWNAVARLVASCSVTPTLLVPAPAPAPPPGPAAVTPGAPGPAPSPSLDPRQQMKQQMQDCVHHGIQGSMLEPMKFEELMNATADELSNATNQERMLAVAAVPIAQAVEDALAVDVEKQARALVPGAMKRTQVQTVNAGVHTAQTTGKSVAAVAAQGAMEIACMTTLKAMAEHAVELTMEAVGNDTQAIAMKAAYKQIVTPDAIAACVQDGTEVIRETAAKAYAASVQAAPSNAWVPVVQMSAQQQTEVEILRVVKEVREWMRFPIRSAVEDSIRRSGIPVSIDFPGLTPLPLEEQAAVDKTVADTTAHCSASLGGAFDPVVQMSCQAAGDAAMKAIRKVPDAIDAAFAFLKKPRPGPGPAPAPGPATPSPAPAPASPPPPAPPAVQLRPAGGSSPAPAASFLQGRAAARPTPRRK